VSFGTPTEFENSIPGGISTDHQVGNRMAFISREGGLVVRFVAGENLVQGEIVSASTSGAGEVVKAPANADMPIGTVYEDAISGNIVWITVAGKGKVLIQDSTAIALGDVLFCSATAGRADGASAVPAALTHWKEIGHALETTAGGTDILLNCVHHFN